MKRKSSLVFFFLIYVSSFVEAGIFLKATDPTIVQDAVWLYSNSTAITSVAPDVEANTFSKRLVPLENLPIVYTEGILYNRDNSCSPNVVQQPIPLPFYAVDPKSTQVPKIAFIKNGNCTIFEKILNAQIEGAIGVIIYDTEADFSNDTLKNELNKGIPSDNNIKIPAYYVDHSVGTELYHQLLKMASVPTHRIPTNDGTNLTTRISVHIQLLPADNIKPAAWELTLLVMIVILATSILFSVAMHIYMWKKSKRLHHVVERNSAAVSISPMGKPLLSVARLEEFPTRTIDDDQECTKVLNDEKQIEALTTALSHPPTSFKRIQNFILGKKQNAMIIKMETSNMCVICLEPFKLGEQVRELPCNHEYHCTCIDPWLTLKSGECPLCKRNCSAVPPPPSGLFANWRGKRQPSILPAEELHTTRPASSIVIATTASEVAVQQAAYETATENHLTMPDNTPVRHSRSFLNSRRVNSRLTLIQDEPRPSIATFEYTPTITTIASTYAAPSDGGILPDIDVSSISLYSIDLEHIAED